jgi:L-arabinokinase
LQSQPNRRAGKGVSSSAALEVAVMTALAAAHGVALGGRELALLCQKARGRGVFALRSMQA